MAATKSMRAKDPEWSYATALAVKARLRAEGRVVPHQVMQSDWDSTIAFLKYYARWRRVARMGSQLRQLPQLLHKQLRLTPLRSCKDVYGD
eukprot:2752416-Prymnesium_polylepis.1